MTTLRSMQATSPWFSLSKPALIDSIAQIFSRCLCSKDVCAGLVACPYPCDSYDEEIRFRNEIFRGRNNTQISVDSAKGHDCELLHVTGATGVYSSQRHRVPVPSHCHWQNVEASSIFKRGAINKRLMVKWKCLLWWWAEQAECRQVWGGFGGSRGSLQQQERERGVCNGGGSGWFNRQEKPPASKGWAERRFSC